MAAPQWGYAQQGPNYVDSPKGSVPPGQAAYSFDGKYFAREVDPPNMGQIGIFSVEGQQLRVVDLQIQRNDIKGIGWNSATPNLLGVMFHGGPGGTIILADAESAKVVGRVPISRDYHSFRFAPDGLSILAEGDVIPIGPLQMPTPTPVPAPTTALPALTPTPTPLDSPQPRFILGFKALADQITGIVGEPLQDEHFGPNGDFLQPTTTGLMVRRKADNWTAFTNGSRTWVNGPNGVQNRGNDERYPWEAPAPAEPAPAATPTPSRSLAPTATAASPTSTARPTPTILPEYVLSSQDRHYGAASVTTSTGLHYRVDDLWSGRRGIVTTRAQYDTWNDAKAGAFSGDAGGDGGRFAAVYHYSSYSWIGVWSLQSGQLITTITVPGWTYDASMAFK